MVISVESYGNSDIINVEAAEYFKSAENQQHYPLLSDVFKYWDTSRSGKFAPDYADIEISNLPLELIPHCAVVDVTSDGTDFIYRYWGTFAANSLGKEMTGKSVLELPSQALSKISLTGYQQVLATKTALVSQTPYKRAFDLDTHEIFMRLPMSSNGVNIDVIMTVIEMTSADLRNLRNQMDMASEGKLRG